MTIQERIDLYKERRDIENKILEDRRKDIIFNLTKARSNESFKIFLDEAIAEVNDRLNRVRTYNLLIEEFEKQKGEEK